MVHATAIVAPEAQIADGVTIGPYCVVGPEVILGPGTQLISHVVVEGRTTLGARNTVYPFAVVGGPPQDRKYRGEPTELLLGDDNVIREHATLNLGTAQGRKRTSLGHRNLLMAGAHVAHDCSLGDDIVLANSVGLAGHVDVDDGAIIGGLAAVHQYCRIGRLAFVGGGSMVAQDVPPFCTAQGDRACLAGLNLVGLRRAQWSHERIRTMRRALRQLFFGSPSRQHSLDTLEATVAQNSDDVAELCRFIRGAERGICNMRNQTCGLDGPDALDAPRASAG